MESNMTNVGGLFPGQGSQSVGMGRDFAEHSELARAIFNEANETLGYDLKALCLEGPLENLTLTQNAQPAILTVSYIAYRLAEVTPVAAAGHSLGEYTALVAAEALSFRDAVQLVHRRGKYLQEAVPEGAGKMIAVLGPTVPEIEAVIATVDVGVKEIANINSPGQTVVSGDVAGIDALAAALTKAGMKVIPLKVSAPFHCSLMKSAERKLAEDIAKVSFSDPKFPVYSNVTATKVTSGSEAKELLVKQVCSPVRWTESMQNMIRDFDLKQSIEFGAGGVLSNLLKRIDKSIARAEIGEFAHVSSLRNAA
ncbi:MAG: ACP S-malonyltransferase [Deltaproteobacteria bacterium]|nr:ACP S-malonyltransferase [Deltaproteobacteria bacterium]